MARAEATCQVSSRSIQPFGHNTPTSQTERQDRTDRQWSDSISRTVLQKVAQKLILLVAIYSVIIVEGLLKPLGYSQSCKQQMQRKLVVSWKWYKIDTFKLLWNLFKSSNSVYHIWLAVAKIVYVDIFWLIPYEKIGCNVINYQNCFLVIQMCFWFQTY